MTFWMFICVWLIGVISYPLIVEALHLTMSRLIKRAIMDGAIDMEVNRHGNQDEDAD